MLNVSMRKHLGSFQLDAAFDVEGGVTALFGRSGSGKTSLLRQIAGLARPDAGRIEWNGRTLVDVEKRIFVPAHQRHFGFVFQDARLFPHLTVQQNLDYGRNRSAPRGMDSDHQAIVSILGLETLLQRKPHHLSGGEKQRVAIARALFSNPELLLLDEPLASLDDARKQEILPLLEQMRDHLNIPMVYVSHSVQEVYRLATNVVVLKDGQVETVGKAADILNQSAFYEAAARHEAGSLVEGIVESFDPLHQLNRLRLPDGHLFVPGNPLLSGQSVRVQIPARDVMISTLPPDGLSALNVLKGTISDLVSENGQVVTVVVNCAGVMVTARLTTLSVERLSLATGMTVYAVIKTVALDQRS